MKHTFTKYLKESCRKSSDGQFSFKYFLHIAFVREISPKLSVGFGHYRHERVKHCSEYIQGNTTGAIIIITDT